MAANDNVGQFQQLVMTAILALDDDAYGVTIDAKVTELTKPRAIALGAIYVTLDGLEDKGLVSSRLTDPTPERGGRAKRCYRLEALGERALVDSAVVARRIWEAVAEALGKAWVRKRGQGAVMRPPPLAERIVTLLLPPPCREHVLGDLAERYRNGIPRLRCRNNRTVRDFLAGAPRHRSFAQRDGGRVVVSHHRRRGLPVGRGRLSDGTRDDCTAS